MKRLYCLRHGQAHGTHINGDHARELTDTGQHDATTRGQEMAKQGHVPDVIYCSDAVRTRQTCEAVMAAFPNLPPVFYKHALYESHIDNYLEIIQNTPDNYQSAMIIGHNPVIHILASQLSSDIDSPDFNRLMCLYPPAAMSIFDVTCDRWGDVKTHCNDLIAFWSS